MGKKVGREQTVDFPCYADRYPTEMLEYLRLMQMTPEDTRGKPLAAFDYTRTISAPTNRRSSSPSSKPSATSSPSTPPPKNRTPPSSRTSPPFSVSTTTSAWPCDT